MTEVDKLKILLDIPESDKTKDEVLRLLIEQAREYLLSYCRISFADETMMPVILNMASEDFGKIGSEGVSYRTVSGASEGYRGTYSPRIVAQLNRWRRPGGLVC